MVYKSCPKYISTRSQQQTSFCLSFMKFPCKCPSWSSKEWRFTVIANLRVFSVLQRFSLIAALTQSRSIDVISSSSWLRYNSDWPHRTNLRQNRSERFKRVLRSTYEWTRICLQHSDSSYNDFRSPTSKWFERADDCRETRGKRQFLCQCQLGFIWPQFSSE